MILLTITWEQAGHFVSSIFNSKFVLSGITSWPLAVIILAILFRSGIKKILTERPFRVEAGGGNGVKIIVDGLIEKTKENLKEAPKKHKKDDKTITNLPELTISKDKRTLKSVTLEAVANPAKSISDTWDLFTMDLGKIISFVSANTSLSFEGDTWHVMDVLHENGNISKSTANAVKGLFDIFQLAEIKSMEENIDKVEFANRAKEYYILCVDALEQLHSELSKTLAKDLQS
ncbi:hypothetical protein P9E03_20805 [Bacillus mojavensis]|uniref:hypothetical protein n=1 Tax=Bacillus mojavensis TaxID=72360 RepID=UPI00228182B8|nr:hypothetical protein [Bacillus mojavensis]MCY8106647.1 hypothetical protein [Bacillus mojavensis]MCY8480137.1 hypothetical protein [Bacillus mojavensis]MCY9090978.1 hypothetical protein [Bacillus mojavensis]MEC1801452.1 hypothetical protein [Bacillus mojavensis]